MPKRTHILTILATLAIAVGSARAQTLAERIAEVRAQHARETAAKSVGELRTELLQKLYYTRFSASFDETPARDVFEYLKAVLDINLIVRYSDDPVGHGIDPETPITLEVEELPAIDILELVLEQCSAVEQCTWQLRNGFIEAGTKERLSADGAQEVRSYPIGDLLYEPVQFEDSPPIGFQGVHYDAARHFGVYPGSFGGYLGHSFGGYYGGGYNTGYSGSFGPQVGRYPGRSGGRYFRPGSGYPLDRNSPEEKAERAQEIVELIVSTIEPMAWRRNGGEWASITYQDGVLIVRAPDYIHRQINGYPPVPKPKAEEAAP
jgi:hypothetical protein